MCVWVCWMFSLKPVPYIELIFYTSSSFNRQHCIIVYSTLLFACMYVRSIVYVFSNLFFPCSVCVFCFLLCFWSCTKIYIEVHLGDITFCVIYWHIQVSPWSHPSQSLSLSDISVSFRLTDTNTLYFGHTHTRRHSHPRFGCRIFVAEEGCWDSRGAIGGSSRGTTN